VPGWSTYLHPIDNGRLLAIGRNGGIKLSLFDVSNLDSPRAIQERVEGGSGSESEALQEHRAFRYLSEQQLLAVPMQTGGSNGLHLYRVTGSGFDPVAVIDHGAIGNSSASVVRRAYQIGDYLYGYSDAGISITDLSSFQTRATVDLSR